MVSAEIPLLQIKKIATSSTNQTWLLAMAKQDGAKQKDPPIIHGESISHRLYSVKIGERQNVTK